jgi:uncharacterized membrane protein YfcA
MIWLVALVVGVLIGAVGVGGILLIPALNLLAALPIKASMQTALFTFIFTGAVGTFFFQRRGSVDWSVTIPLCIGGALFGVVGAWASGHVDSRWLALILAVLIIAAGAYTLAGMKEARDAPFAGQPRARVALLFSIGAITGFGSGLTGVGGPALSVPMMMLAGFPALVAIGASQVIQILAAISGSAPHLLNRSIDLEFAGVLALFEVAGVWMGVHLAHAVDAKLLRRAVGILCVLVGSAMVVRSL